MARYWLINVTTLGTHRLMPGVEVNEDVDDVGAIRGAGGVLVPQGDPIVDAAASRAHEARMSRGADEQEISRIMQSALEQSRLTQQQPRSDEEIQTEIDEEIAEVRKTRR